MMTDWIVSDKPSHGCICRYMLVVQTYSLFKLYNIIYWRWLQAVWLEADYLVNWQHWQSRGEEDSCASEQSLWLWTDSELKELFILRRRFLRGKDNWEWALFILSVIMVQNYVSWVILSEKKIHFTTNYSQRTDSVIELVCISFI